jgi:putative FmdB family regulatory protein
VVSYEYRCPADGPFDARHPMGSAPPSCPCPRCGAAAPRRIGAPRLGLAPRHLVAAIDSAERSRTEPEVVGRPAGSPRRPAPAPRINPAWHRLPRP